MSRNDQSATIPASSKRVNTAFSWNPLGRPATASAYAYVTLESVHGTTRVGVIESITTVPELVLLDV